LYLLGRVILGDFAVQRADACGGDRVVAEEEVARHPGGIQTQVPSRSPEKYNPASFDPSSALREVLMIRICWLCALLVVAGCGGGPPVQDAQSAVRGGAAQAAQQPDAVAATDATAPLAEFEPLARADADLYLKVMRTAAARLKNLSAADRQALKTFQALTTRTDASQMPSAEEMAAMQRAGELMALDSVVARELGVEKRYQSIRGRVPQYGMPEMTGEGDDPMTPEQRAALKVRIEKFKERRRLDGATLAPFKDEIQALQKQVDLIAHPQSIPTVDSRPSTDESIASRSTRTADAPVIVNG
jgi:hypothetical protein